MITWREGNVDFIVVTTGICIVGSTDELTGHLPRVVSSSSLGGGGGGRTATIPLFPNQNLGPWQSSRDSAPHRYYHSIATFFFSTAITSTTTTATDITTTFSLDANPVDRVFFQFFHGDVGDVIVNTIQQLTATGTTMTTTTITG